MEAGTRKNVTIENGPAIVLEVCSPWILTRFRWERGQASGGGWKWRAGGTNGESRILAVSVGTGNKPLIQNPPLPHAAAGPDKGGRLS